MRRRCLWALALFLVAGAMAAEPAGRNAGARQPVQVSQANEVPAHAFDLVLARPALTAITLSVLCYQATEGSVAYGTNAAHLASATPPRAFPPGEPVEILLAGLAPDTRYYYQFRCGLTNSAIYSFHTARPAGSTFTFTITADSHLDDRTDLQLYQRTLLNAWADAPDFHVDLGDTFMTEKHPSREAAARQYLAQRYYLGQLAAAAPLFCVLGNHDGETMQGRGQDPASLAIWSSGMRKRYFPNPVPDDFYRGNTTAHPAAGLLQDYYAWEWGNALFVVLDPFWFTPRPRGADDNWRHTLGAAQYEWLQRCLAASRAELKLVFIHNLVGGADRQCRGGAEAAPFYEWGGQNADGSDGFARNRPGWAEPIHTLLRRHKVAIVFHGHDHLYACQTWDGIIYQAVPQPGFPGGGGRPPFATEYGYKQGTMLGSSGYLKVTVNGSQAAVAYLRSDAAAPGGRVWHSYEVSR